MPVRLHGLRDAFLNGLTGDVQSIDGTHGTLLLDPRSTSKLRLYGASRLHVPRSAERHALSGVPLICCIPQQ